MSQFSHHNPEESRRIVELAIRRNHIKTDGNWFTSIAAVGMMLAFPVGFTWLCLDFLPEVNLMNVFLCSITACLSVYCLAQIIWYVTCSHRLLAVHTDRSRKKSRAITRTAFTSAGYTIRESSEYFMVASKRVGYRSPEERVTALFQDDVVYLHVQIVSPGMGDEHILWRRKPILKALGKSIGKVL